MENLTYNNFIENILITRGRFACGDEYHERHHIIPRCVGGTNDEENLIDLYAREHFIAHKLLANENPENESLIYAWWMMSHINNKTQERYELTPEEYEESRKCYSTMRSYAISGEKNPNFGKQMPDDMRDRISKALLGENGYWYGKHHTEESKNKMREANSGPNHPQCRPVYCYELDEYFWGVTAAADKYHINGSSISQCCRGKLGSAGKHPVTGKKLHWVYVDEMNNSPAA